LSIAGCDRARFRRSELVQQAIVRRPAHPRRLVGVFVIGRVAAKPQAQLASAPEGSVILSLSLRGVGKLIRRPRSTVIFPKPGGASRRHPERSLSTSRQRPAGLI